MADLESTQSETVALLQRLIGFDTTNPPGNELPLARDIHSTLTAEGIAAQLLIPADNRAAVVARISGDGSARPVMLLAHMDVVAVEADKWSCDPFGGVLRDGYVYGRGAIDDKGMLAANIMAMLLLQRNVVSAGGRLKRDVVFVATSDEEAGGSAGIRWLVENHRELLDAEFAINEGGRTRITAGGKGYLAIQTAEKISHMVTVTARGPSGHAAIPLADNAIFRLGRALEKLGRFSEPVTLTATTRRFFEGLAAVWPDKVQATAMVDLVANDGATQAKGADVLSRIPVFNAVIRNTVSPTYLSGGVQGNVIPAEVKAELNVRTVPGQSLDDLVSRLSHALADDEIEITVSYRGAESPPSDPDSAMFDALSNSAKELDGDITVVPYLSTGGTDSAALRRIGINCYGILPFPMVQADEERMHGHDERVPVESLHFGTRLIYESIRRIATS